MRFVKTFIIFACVVFFGLSLNAWSQDKTPAKANENPGAEPDREFFKKTMNRTFKARIQGDRKFCRDFLKDFSEQKNIHYYKPIVEVDKYNDEKLQACFKGCPNNDFNANYRVYHPSMMAEMTKAEASGRKITSKQIEEEFGGIKYEATRNFRLFKVDIDNNPKNGEEYILYAEGYFNQDQNMYIGNAYTILDLKKCETRAVKSLSHDTEYSGIMRYRNNNYILVFDRELDRLSLIKYSKKRKNLNEFCAYWEPER